MLQSPLELLTGAKSPLFIYGPDAARGERGRQAVTALSNLAIALGFGDRLAYVGAEANSQGARDMGMLPDALPGHLPVSDAAVRERLGKLWGVQPPAETGSNLRPDDRRRRAGAVRDGREPGGGRRPMPRRCAGWTSWSCRTSS